MYGLAFSCVSVMYAQLYIFNSLFWVIKISPFVFVMHRFGTSACPTTYSTSPPAAKGIYRAAVGAASWDSHPRMVLMWLPSLLEAVTGQKYHCPRLLFIAHNSCRLLSELNINAARSACLWHRRDRTRYTDIQLSRSCLMMSV